MLWIALTKTFCQAIDRSPAGESQDALNQNCIFRILMKEEENYDDTFVASQVSPIAEQDKMGTNDQQILTTELSFKWKAIKN